MLPPTLTHQTLASASAADLRHILDEVAGDSLEARGSLDPDAGSHSAVAFLSVIGESSATTRLAIGSAVLDVLDAAIADTKKAVGRKSKLLSLLVIAEFCTLEAAIADTTTLIDQLERIGSIKDADLISAAARCLATIGTHEAIDALSRLLKPATSAHALPSLIAARTALTPFQALDLADRTAALQQSHETPEFILAVRNAIHAMFDDDPVEAKRVVPQSIRSWPPSARHLVKNILDEAPLTDDRNAREAARRIVADDDAASDPALLSPWQRYLRTARLTKKVPATVTGFSEGSDQLYPRNTPNAYQRLHREIQAEVESTLQVSGRDAKLELRIPHELNRLVDDLLDGETLLLDLQWQTRQRARRASMLRLGETEAFALLCRTRDVEQLEDLLKTQPADNVHAMRKYAVENRQGYRDRAVALSHLVKLIGIEGEADLSIFVQSSSAISDEITDAVDAIAKSANGRATEVAHLCQQQITRLEDVDAILLQVALNDAVPVALIEYNPVSPIPQIRDVLKKGHISAAVREAVESEAEGFSIFPARHERPLSIGYFYPHNDTEMRDAYRNASFRAFTRRTGNAREWHPEFRELATDLGVVLDPVGEAFPEMIRNTEKVVPLKRAKKKT